MRAENALTGPGTAARPRSRAWTIRIATLEDGKVCQWRPAIVTLGDALDYGFGILVTCTCSRRIVVKPASDFKAGRVSVDDSTRIEFLKDRPVCPECGGGSGVMTRPTETPSPGVEPRVGYKDNPWRGVW